MFLFWSPSLLTGPTQRYCNLVCLEVFDPRTSAVTRALRDPVKPLLKLSIPSKRSPHPSCYIPIYMQHLYLDSFTMKTCTQNLGPSIANGIVKTAVSEESVLPAWLVLRFNHLLPPLMLISLANTFVET